MSRRNNGKTNDAEIGECNDKGGGQIYNQVAAESVGEVDRNIREARGEAEK
jgi:hypothetical protein